jgi:carotenoid cleavage dioxygenase-like enzyme
MTMAPAFVGVTILMLLGSAFGHGGHGILLPLASPNPGAMGYESLHLNMSYTNVRLHVQGEVPSYLGGTLYRGAPGYWPDGWWLDGLITLNAFKFSGGSVSYSMRWNKDDAYNRTVNKVQPPSLPVESAMPGALMQPRNASFPTGVAFSQVQGQLIHSTGVSNVNCVDPDTLDPLEMPFVFGDEFDAPFLAPTHDITVDGHTLHHLVTGVVKGSGGTPGYVVTSIKPGGRKRDVIATIENPKESAPFHGDPSFQHMPLATSEYYIMLETPCYYPTTDTQIGHVDWKGFRSNPLARTHVRLVSRKSGESIIYPLSHNIFAIHHINAYYNATSNSIVVDTIRLFPSFLPCSLAFTRLTMDHYVNTSTSGSRVSTPLRLTLPLDKPGSYVDPEPLAPGAVGMEFPTIRYDDLNGKPYRYAYGCWMVSDKSDNFDSLIKVDVQTGNYTYWHIDGHYPGEPIFVPDPNGSAEDDGVVMTNVLDIHRKETYVLLLDARTMKELARAGPTPHFIPHGYHGRYFDKQVGHNKDDTVLV